MGEGGRRFVRRLVELSGVYCSTDVDSDSGGGNNKHILAVPTTLNSISTDIRRWRSLGIPAKTSSPAEDVAQSYFKLGCRPDSLTCAPYLVDDFVPSKAGEHVVWVSSKR